jgi:alkaline phosphatase
MKKLLTVLLVVTLIIAVTPSLVTSSAAQQPEVKNVIYMIGDGMGVNQARAAEIYAAEVMGKALAFSSFPNRTTTTTFSLSSQVTDSAAAGSALHSGYKFENGAINVLPEGDYTYTLGQAAQAAGKSVGILSTTRMTHATPASVFGHVENRDLENELAAQLVEFEPTVAMAGGSRAFLPDGVDGGRREDGRDLIQEMVDKGYTYVSNAEELAAIDAGETDRLLGFFNSSHMSYEVERVNQNLNEPSLASMTSKALDILSKNENGFFIMIEGGRIDHAAHAWDLKGMIDDTLAFSDAIQVALDFQAENPDTLVIVTADHETGGFGLGRYTGYGSDIPVVESITCSMEYLNSLLEEDNAVDVAEKCGISLDEADVELLAQHPANMSVEDREDIQGGYAFSWGHLVLSDAVSRQAQVGWTSWSHTGQPVITYAVGPHADMFEGALDNTDLPKMIGEFAGLTFEEPAQPTMMAD